MFQDSLEMSLELTVAGESFTVPGAHIKFLRIDLRPYGFKARLSFWVSSETGTDELFPEFIKDDMIEVKLSVEPHFKPEEEGIEPLDLHGLVMDKAILQELTIENIHLSGNPVLYRHYRIDFADPARVLWGQHFPCDLVVDGSVEDLIEANKATGVELKYDWSALEDTFAINTLPAQRDHRGASFYDFIVWYTASHNGIFSYDSQNNKYTLSDSKVMSGESIRMSKLETAEQSIVFPKTIRYNDRMLNVFSEDPVQKETSRSQAEEAVRRDTLVRLPIASDFEDAFQLESEKPKIRGHEIHLVHSRIPQITFRTGIFIILESGLWSEEMLPYGIDYRVRDIFLLAKAVNDRPDADHNLSYSRYNIKMRSKLELKEEKAATLPSFNGPPYPIFVEGKIVSEQGKEEEETYQTYEHPQTAIDQYRVALPIFEDKQIVVPYEPLFAPGHFYFPAYKGQRVLVALDFHTAWIERFLDWRPGGRLPMDSQGDHLLLGKTDKSNTSISHVYVDNKPQLNMKRTSDSDTQKIQFHEGTIILETREENE